MASRGRPRAIARLAACGAGLCALALVAVLATRPAATQTAPSPLVGKMAPPVSGRDLAGGIASLSRDRGRFVVLNFFASWCPPCRTETPQLERFLYGRPSGQRVAVLGVVFGDSASNAAAFERSLGASWPAVLDPSEQIAVSYGVDDPPQSFLIAPDGRVADRIVGGVTATGLDALVSKAVRDGM
jgi:cytochrome c biogenesis protein CcmG, thiol:disulfide interchange protein DsbE